MRLSQRLKRLSQVVFLHGVFSLPYLWLWLFLAAPFFILLGISFSESVIRIPPYKPLFVWLDDYVISLKLHLESYWLVLSDPLYAFAYWNAFKMAFLTMGICLILAYPAAYYLVQCRPLTAFLGLVFLMVPFWISFLIRVYAWMGLLGEGGWICWALQKIGVLGPYDSLVGTSFSVLLGLVYTYLPFMVLPVYNALEKVDPRFIEAALDLGCSPMRAFWRVVFPLSWRGVLTGCVLVLIPVVGEFSVPELLGGNKVLMIGQVIWSEFFYNHDWPMACALAIVMLSTLALPIMILGRLQKSSARLR